MMESEEIKALSTAGETDDAGLARVQPHPEPAEHHRRQVAGLLGPLPGRRQDHEVIAVAHQRPQPPAVSFHA